MSFIFSLWWKLLELHLVPTYRKGAAQSAYYAKCLVNCPLPDSSCESIAYGAGLSRSAAMENAAYYASAKGHRNCGHYIRDCEVQQYKKPTSHVNAGW
ncbi:unnamed protein product [Schistocephalus solidus]|uniref:SCP domain-containing protein n=1 Tax=Schistocephalus solidus TaxID=70667 RepID=A0A183TM68_SCHSO|nr:unnamed protein product [Schistocephalus solidus]